MTCDEARRHWNLFHDSEGDAEMHFRIGEHLATCPDCAQWFDQESRLEHLVAEKLRSGPETPVLWDRVLAESGLKQRPRSHRHLMVFVGVATCAASVLIACIELWVVSGTRQGADLAELTASWHVRLVDGREPVPFRSRSDLEVEEYLRGRVSFPVRCPPRHDAGFAVRGSGVCTLADQPTAFLVGRVGEVPVSIFVLPSSSLDAFPHLKEQMRRGRTHRRRQGPYEMAVAVIDRNVVLVVGGAEPERLQRVLDAYGSYPHTHAHSHSRAVALPRPA